jgi:hypothetical protein
MPDKFAANLSQRVANRERSEFTPAIGNIADIAWLAGGQTASQMTGKDMGFLRRAELFQHFSLAARS